MYCLRASKIWKRYAFRITVVLSITRNIVGWPWQGRSPQGRVYVGWVPVLCSVFRRLKCTWNSEFTRYYYRMPVGDLTSRQSERQWPPMRRTCWRSDCNTRPVFWKGAHSSSSEFMRMFGQPGSSLLFLESFRRQLLRGQPVENRRLLLHLLLDLIATHENHQSCVDGQLKPDFR